MTNARLGALDQLRGLAVVAMVIYHFSWDLTWFHLVDWPVANGIGWRAFAAAIAGSFLFLSGVTLSLAHGDTIRWRALLRSKILLLIAAIGVSTATYFVFSSSFVRFGILHCLFLSGLLALPFLGADWRLTLVGAVGIGTLPIWGSTPYFDGQLWLWTGLGRPDFGSVDYVPLAPWAGLVLAGQALVQSPLYPQIQNSLQDVRSRPSLQWLGRHSLAIYIIHQPLLFGLLWIPANVGLLPDPAQSRFVESCAAVCSITEGANQPCKNICRCTVDALIDDKLWDPLVAAPDDSGLRQKMNDRYAQCATRLVTD